MIARASVEVICIGYVYKPSRRQMDAVVAAVNALAPCVPGLSVAHVYEFAMEQSLREYREDPERYAQELRFYLKRRARDGVDGSW